jgi:hypothetical protein
VTLRRDVHLERLALPEGNRMAANGLVSLVTEGLEDDFDGTPLLERPCGVGRTGWRRVAREAKGRHAEQAEEPSP